MFTLLLRKMRNTKWMVFCLLIGFIMASAMMSTIPIYMNASLQRMLVKDMDAFQEEFMIYPGSYNTSRSFKSGMATDKQLQTMKDYVKTVDEQFAALDLPDVGSKKVMLDTYLYCKSFSIADGESAARLTVGGMSDITEHSAAASGRMMQKGQRDDGVFECMATEKSLKTNGLALDTVYEIANVMGGDASIKIEIVGLLDVADENDPYWAEGIDEAYTATVFTDYDTMLDEMLPTGAVNLSKASYNYFIDYTRLDIAQLGGINNSYNKQKETFKKSSIGFTMPAKDILSDYAKRSEQLTLLLWLLQIPVILMIVFYLFMVSKLNIEQEKNEIAVFKSRGASNRQVLGIYAMESMVLGIITAAAGPFAGLGLCRILGASNGFLEFVNRRAMPVRLTAEAFIYAAAAVLVFFVTTLVPIIPASKTTIVEHKQSKAKKKKHALWEKVGLDIILAGGSFAWLYYYNRTQAKLLELGVTDTTATVNPLMFVTSTAFILGLGLFLIRVYPLFIRIISRIGQRFWSPAQYVSLTNIGRSTTGRERFLMLFLVLTVSLGIFFANTARAINRNAEETVYYANGADIVLTEEWYSSKTEAARKSAAPTANGAPQQAAEEPSEDDDTATVVTYTEPVFERFEKLAGVRHTAKVFRHDGVTLKSSKMTVVKRSANTDKKNREDYLDQNMNAKSANTDKNVQLMTIQPADFAEVINFEPRLLPTHINNYLEALAEYTPGVILSSSFRDYGLELGDTVECEWGANDPFDVTVLAFADYWPSLDPYAEAGDGSYMDFAVMNFDYVNVQTNMEPYQVWIDLEDDASVQDFYNSVEAAHIEGTGMTSAKQELIAKKNDPMLQGMNGALTLGFITIMIMCIIGFLIYWILSIKSRTLQFGILRAMGMKYREIIAMIVYEQILVSGVAILAAIFIGGITSELFVPLFQSVLDVSSRVPEFVVIPQRSDYLKLYAVIAAMLLVGFLVLGRLIGRINISKALKLGED
ncbi:ABC transporter permease [uncultured Ruminococcus sp.]|uniref:ABC transporter permease n=1 Tax=uncultured Ruminococcus sp. TaxID=165186 RepID=UPI000EDF2D0C|nr:ABC transporter permease [uncultured Ruminococcus sp.]HCJ41381.1 ABC transporter permease [Ruminococcus sp.]